MKIGNKEVDHLWEFEGDLYTEKFGKDKYKIPLRKDYSKHFKQINNTKQFKASLRAGPVAWPGCYPVLFVCSDGGLFCHECARKNARQIIYSIRNNCSDGWKVEASCIEATSPEIVKEFNPKKELIGANVQTSEPIEIEICSNCNKEFGELT